MAKHDDDRPYQAYVLSEYSYDITRLDLPPYLPNRPELLDSNCFKFYVKIGKIGYLEWVGVVESLNQLDW